MCAISNSAGSSCARKEPSEDRDSTNSFTGQDYYQDLIDLANTVPLVKIFKQYNIHCNESSFHIRCPFKSHKGGRENSASFKYYHETDSFFCFGCNVGGSFAHASHFVAAMEGISLRKAAYKIIDSFKGDLGEINNEALICDDSDERLKIMLEFSESVRDFYQSYCSDDAKTYIDEVCRLYDTLMIKHKLDNEALCRLVEQLKNHISLYKP